MLRDSPPDILLTNYKMLDFLLPRPEDRRLWQHNGTDTLRYLVLDEHAFANEGLLRMAEAAFAALPFPPDEREGIRAGNAARLFPALVDRRSPTEPAR